MNLDESTTGRNKNSLRYAKATVNSVCGILIFPDNYVHPDGVTPLDGNNNNNKYGKFSLNNYGVDDFEKMEEAGVVFLPAAGYRFGGADIQIVGNYCVWWSSTIHATMYSRACSWCSYDYKTSSGGYNRNTVGGTAESNLEFGCSIRLVQ